MCTIKNGNNCVTLFHAFLMLAIVALPPCLSCPCSSKTCPPHLHKNHPYLSSHLQPPDAYTDRRQTNCLPYIYYCLRHYISYEPTCDTRYTALSYLVPYHTLHRTAWHLTLNTYILILPNHNFGFTGFNFPTSFCQISPSAIQFLNQEF